MDKKGFREWLAEGEEIYSATLQEYQSLEAQLDELEKQLAAKKSELSEIARVIGKPPVEGVRRVSGQVIEPEHPGPTGSAGNIARALTGRGLSGR